MKLNLDLFLDNLQSLIEQKNNEIERLKKQLAEAHQLIKDCLKAVMFFTNDCYERKKIQQAEDSQKIRDRIFNMTGV